MLSETAIASYHPDGYVIPKNFRFNDEELAELHAGLDAILANNPDIMPDRLMNPHLNKASRMELVRGENRNPLNDFTPGDFGQAW